jgi:hypothetical protein
MSQSHMTHWIEIADERHFFEDAMVNGREAEEEGHFLHLGDTIVRIASWVHRRVSWASMPEAIH